MTDTQVQKNRLAGEKSPYLLQHALNPVNWFVWGEEAFEKAKHENLPLFLSVGYSTCHWCHVMERESFENIEIAELLNRYFISVKVDREELPDIDRLDMNYLQSTTGKGGWPMSIWLTTDRKPFYGGSYFPPEDRYGLPGFKTILVSIAGLWKSNEKKIIDTSDTFFSYLDELSSKSPAELPGENEAQTKCLQWLETYYDEEFGGFGAAPKFPRPVLLNFLFNQAYYTGNKDARIMALNTLRKMAEGGIHDHISVPGKGGGGFARYSTDAHWHVPHFEKMLYDNAQLAISYLEAFQCRGDNFYRAVAQDIFNYVLCDMTSPEGGFYSAEDADSFETHDDISKKEGAFYLWSAAELREILDDTISSEIFFFIYGISNEGNAQYDPHGEFIGKNILIQQAPVEKTAEKFGKTAQEINSILEKSRKLLYEARRERPRPALDDKILTSWNGLMISALSKGYRVLHHSQYLDAAKRAAGFVMEKLYDQQKCRLLRRYRDGNAAIAGKTEDYAFFVQGLIDLYEASLESQYLITALELNELQNTLFYDNTHGGYYSTPIDDNSVPLRIKENYDGAEPSANSISALNLLRLSELTGKEEFAIRAEEIFRSCGTTLAEQSHALPQMLVAINFMRNKKCRVILTGDLLEPEMAQLRKVIDDRYLPGTVVIHASNEISTIQRYPETIQTRAEHPQASVCIDQTCLLPVMDPVMLATNIYRARLAPYDR